MKFKKYIFWFFGIFILTFVVLFAASGSFSTISSSGNLYTEYRCEDVSTYKAQGYTTEYIDEYGCEIVSKLSPDRTIQQEVLSLDCISADYLVDDSYWIAPDNNPLYNKLSPKDQDTYRRVYGSGERKCYNNFGSSWAFSGCKNPDRPDDTGYCSPLIKDIQGGYTAVVNTCEFDQNDLLAGETFAAGQSIDKFSTRYPIKSFCKAHPAIFTDDAQKESITSTTVYDKLWSGETVKIPEGQTLTLFYIIENNENLPTICSSEDNLALNIDTQETCLSTLGFTYFCSEGVFDSLTGTCVVQPEAKTICEQGRYDVELDMCVYNPPLQVDCQKDNCFYSVDRNVCDCYTEQTFVCPNGFTFTEPQTLDECNIAGGVWDLCPQCPADKVCTEELCQPRCSEGQICSWDSPLLLECINPDSVLRDGECVVDGELVTECPSGYTLEGNACYITGTATIECPSGSMQVGENCLIEGETIFVCPEGLTFNPETKFCEKVAEEKIVCDDGTEPTKDPITGRISCISTPPVFINCPENTVYNQQIERCEQSIQIFDTKTESFTLYKEIQKQCDSDSVCKAIDESLACNKERGVCYTDIRAAKAENIVLEQTVKNLKNSLYITMAISLIMLIGVALIKRKK